jgi:nucleoside-diphosphate-sugar epimerase
MSMNAEQEIGTGPGEASSDPLLQGRRILVTGASGFIGAHLCRRMAGAGAEVHAISRQPPGAADIPVQWWQADLGDRTAVREVVAGVRPGLILHLAGEVVGARGIEQVMPTLCGNLLSTVHLLEAAVESGCERVVLTGSIEEPNQGDPAAVPSSPYAASKLAATGYGRMFHALYGLDVVILRVFMVYGPAQRDPRKLVPFVINTLLRGETPSLSSGRRPVDWIHVDDVVEAFMAVARSTAGGGGIFEIGSGSLLTVRDLVERLAPLVRPDARLDFNTASDRPLEQVRVADITRAAEVFGWVPRVPIDEGLRGTVEWYRRSFEQGGATA